MLAQTPQRFAHCWPISDRAVGREFRNVVYKWLEALKKAGHIPWDVAVRRSYLDECKGERFDELMLCLSNHVVEVVLERDFAPDFAPGREAELPNIRRTLPTACSVPVDFVDPERQAELASMLRLSIQLEMDRTADGARRELETQKRYNQIAEKITSFWLASEESQAEVTNLRNAIKYDVVISQSPSRQEPLTSMSTVRTTCIKNRGLGGLSDNHIADFDRLATCARLQAQDAENVWLGLLTWATKSRDRRGFFKYHSANDSNGDFHRDAVNPGSGGLLRQPSPYAENDDSLSALLPTFRLAFVDIFNLMCKLELLSATSAAVPECANATLETVRNQRKIIRTTIHALRKRLRETEERIAAQYKDLELRYSNIRNVCFLHKGQRRCVSHSRGFQYGKRLPKTAGRRNSLCDAHPTARLSGTAVSSTLRASIEKIRAEIREHGALAVDKRNKAVSRAFPN
ncbi:MAG: hypothetical protein BJ554DRAFT_6950 [Olpidium bornovanus]|uniref:HAUS augmin-like complex subunit 6 N-terminal domain-containing protein n=1 Tax=Olpidium bornovanus TaxID=278681 RepID=A0A8H8DKB5_9FUNG|nr:MAG: hypothetical protein BJ554DRAFT_6950 [Olpidium bornovanus]